MLTRFTIPESVDPESGDVKVRTGGVVSVGVLASPVSEISSMVRLPTHDIACHMVSDVTPTGGVSVSCTPVAVAEAGRSRKKIY